MLGEQAVLVSFAYGEETLDPLYDLEDELTAMLEPVAVGELDGHDLAVDLSEGTLYLYGPDARALFDAIRPVLEAEPFLKGAQVVLRFGPPAEGTLQETLHLPG